MAASTMRTGGCGGLIQPFCDAMFVEDHLTTPQDQQFLLQVLGLLHANDTGVVIRDERRDKTRLQLETLDRKTRDEDVLLHNATYLRISIMMTKETAGAGEFFQLERLIGYS